MLTSPSSSSRVAGKALIAVVAVAALPLTASRATEYVDVAQASAPTPVAAPAAVPAAAPAPAPLVPATPAAAPTRASGTLPYPDIKGVHLDKGSVAYMGDDTILIDGTHKRLDQLSPEQRARLRANILKSQSELAKERTELPARLAEAQQAMAKIRSGEFKAELLRDRDDLQRDLARIDSEAAEIRAGGEDPAKRKAEILRDLKELDSMDIEKQVSEAMEDANPARIAAELQNADAQMTRLIAKLDQLDRQ